MRAQRTVAGCRRRRVCCAVSLNSPGVKSSIKRAERRRILRGSVHGSASEMNASRARQMAGEAERSPKRPFRGEREENAKGNGNANVTLPPGKKTQSDAGRGKENARALTRDRRGASTAETGRTGACGSQTAGDPSIFFDEDSNHIFPVEQFFGNIDIVENDPRRTPGSKRMSRREYRSLHFYAKEDSEEEQL